MTTLTAAERPYRIASIDILRGIVMIIMALDHTRVFFHKTAMTADPLNADTTTAWLYFTRWITHFCAPTFVFLSGLSAYLSAQKKSKREASGFMIKRGIWLVIVELVVVGFGLNFDPGYHFIILQVIWAIGLSMIILGLLSRISFHLVLITGLVLFFGHNILDHISLPETGTAALIWKILFTSFGTVVPLGNNHFIGIFYAVLPWTGVMLLGYCAGYYFRKGIAAEQRKRFLLVAGISLIALFILLRFVNVYGNPQPWKEQEGALKNVFVFLNTSKYPPSLQYLCMTLGPALLLLYWFENSRGMWTRIVSVYGRVPFFYYILHFYLLHFILVIVFFATNHSGSEIATGPFFFRPIDFGYGLPVVYLIWMSVVALLYFPSRWFNKYKQEHSQWWLRYL